MGEDKLIGLIKDLLNEEDAVNWGWGYDAIELIGDKIAEAYLKFPKDTNCSYDDYVQRVMGWLQEYFGDG